LRDGKEKHATIGRSVERTMWSSFFKSVHEHAPSVQLDRSLYRLLTQVRTSRLTEPALTTLPAPIEFDNVAPLPVRTSLKKGGYIIREQLTPSSGERAYTAIKLLRDEVAAGDNEDAHRKRLKYLLKEIALPVMLRNQQHEAYIESLRDEVCDLQKINHASIAKVEEFFVDSNRAFLVLESVRGISLRQKISSDGPMTEDEVRKLGFELGEIIACLQSCSPPVVHGRLTPDHIIFAESGAVKLADLPFSRLQRRRDDLAFTKALAYMSPECLTGRREQGSDIFSLGAILFFALTGREPTPFGRLDVTAITKGRLEEVIATSSQSAARHRPSLEHLMNLLRD
jgi:serine/threonine protein kinase